MAFLEVDGLAVAYGTIRAVRNISLVVEKGELVALLGPNGAGKSTTLMAIMGLVTSQRGRVIFDGVAITRWPTERIVRSGLTLVPEGRRVFTNLSVSENLRLGAVGAADRGALPEDELMTCSPVLPTGAANLQEPCRAASNNSLRLHGRSDPPRLLLLDEPSLTGAPSGRATSIFANCARGRRSVVEVNVNLALEIADRLRACFRALRLGYVKTAACFERRRSRLSRYRSFLMEIFSSARQRSGVGGLRVCARRCPGLQHLGLVNFAHGEVDGYGYALLFLASTALPIPVTIVSHPGCRRAALLMERIAFRLFREAAARLWLLTSFVVSVILQTLFQDLIDPRGKPVPIAAGLNHLVSVFGLKIALIQLISISTSLTLLLAISLFMSRTTLGISVRAAAQDFQVTRLMGISANAVVATVFAISGLLAGAAGVLWVAQRAIVDPFMGLAPVLAAFVAAVIGGLGSLSGAVLAGFILGFIEIMVRAFLPPDFQPLREGVIWFVVIAVLLVRPDGLFKRAAARA